MSLCGSKKIDHLSPQQIGDLFKQYEISESLFKSDKSICARSDLIFMIKNRYMALNDALPIIVGKGVFGCDLSETMLEDKGDTKEIESIFLQDRDKGSIVSLYFKSWWNKPAELSIKPAQTPNVSPIKISIQTSTQSPSKSTYEASEINYVKSVRLTSDQLVKS